MYPPQAQIFGYRWQDTEAWGGGSGAEPSAWAVTRPGRCLSNCQQPTSRSTDMRVNDYDVELFEAIEDLAAQGAIDTWSPAFGAAQVVVQKGYDRLTPKQRALYGAEIVPALKRRADELRTIRATNAVGP
jgi:hypothetical protein